MTTLLTLAGITFIITGWKAEKFGTLLGGLLLTAAGIVGMLL